MTIPMPAASGSASAMIGENAYATSVTSPATKTDAPISPAYWSPSLGRRSAPNMGGAGSLTTKERSRRTGRSAPSEEAPDARRLLRLRQRRPRRELASRDQRARRVLRQPLGQCADAGDVEL